MIWIELKSPVIKYNWVNACLTNDKESLVNFSNNHTIQNKNLQTFS